MDPFIVVFLIFPTGVPDVNCYNSENVWSQVHVSLEIKKPLYSLAITRFEYSPKNSESDFGEIRGVIQMVQV